MNIEELQKKLITAARNHPPAEGVPYAFEKRILARLASRPIPDLSALWARALWRAAAPCVAIMLALGAWSWLAPRSGVSSGDYSQDIENTLLAAVDQDTNLDSTW